MQCTIPYKHFIVHLITQVWLFYKVMHKLNKSLYHVVSHEFLLPKRLNLFERIILYIKSSFSGFLDYKDSFIGPTSVYFKMCFSKSSPAAGTFKVNLTLGHPLLLP